MPPDIYILGIGHNTAITIELAEACGYNVAGLYHYTEGKTGEVIYGIPVLGTHSQLLQGSSLVGKNFALSMGDNVIREKLFHQIKVKGGSIPALIHPASIVSRYATIGEGTQIDAYCVIHANATIKENCNLQPYVHICHNSELQEHSFVAAKSIIGAYIRIEHHAFIGMAAVLISSKVKHIGHSCIIGAGAVVTKNFPAECTIAGIPAKIIK